MGMTVDEVFKLIKDERRRQYCKWGLQEKTREQWMAVICEEFLEVVRAVNDKDPEDKYRAELVQLAALCCQILEG